MPAANCLVAKDLYGKAKCSKTLVELWSDESGKSAEHMTINIIACTEQQGNAYPIMANLFLPSLWSKQDVDLLQVGLSEALAKYFNVDTGSVHVITCIVESGMVVEEGKINQW